MKKVLFTVLFLVILLSGFFIDDGTVYGDESIVVGLECNYAPFNWTQLDDRNGAVPISNAIGYCGGYDVEIAKAIANDLGKELVIKKITDFDTLPIVLNIRDIDLIIAGMSPTKQRLQAIAFSESYYYSDLVLVTKAESPLANATSLEEFEGARVGAQIGTMHNDLIGQIPMVDHATPMTDISTLAVAVKAGELDAMVTEKPVAMAIVATNPTLSYIDFSVGSGFVLATDDQESLTVAIGLRKNEDELLAAINKSLSQITTEDRDALMEQAISNQPSSIGGE